MLSILSLFAGGAARIGFIISLISAASLGLYWKGRTDGTTSCQLQNWALERDILRSALDARNTQRSLNGHTDELLKNDGYLRPNDPMPHF